MFQFNIILFILYLFVSCVNARSAPEPLCSKFSYDEQMLEKMVRVEFNVNNMDKNLLETEGRMKEIEQKMMETRTELMRTNESMSKTLKEIDEKLRLLEEKESISDNEIVAFNAYEVADKSVANNQVFVFTEVLLNEGNGYSSSNGYFSAPVSGIYFFNSHLCAKNKENINYVLAVNGKIHASGLFTANGEGRCSSFSVTVRMRAAERAWITIDEGGSSSKDILYEDGDDWNFFNGFLIRQTP